MREYPQKKSFCLYQNNGGHCHFILATSNFSSRLMARDTRHGFAHRDLLDKKDRKRKTPVFAKDYSEAPKFDFRYEHQNGRKETEIAIECLVLDIRFSFDVGRSMLDVHFLM